MRNNSIRFAAFFVLLVSYLTYQNCAPSGKGSAFNVGSSNNGPVISMFNLSQGTYAANDPMSGSANVASGDSNLICVWTISNVSGTVQSFNTPLLAGVCSLPNGTTAPAVQGAYNILLSVTDNENKSTSGNLSFVVSAPGSPTPTPTPTPTPSASPSPTPVPIKYSCPNIGSNSCSDSSRCETTCDGNFSNNSTCTYYNMNAVPTTVNCTPVTSVASIYNCSFIHSNSCNDGSLCNSTCEGQYQGASSCTYYNSNAVPTNVACTSIKSAANQALYSCPRITSSSCTSASACESNCVGQVGKSSTCFYYLSGGVPITTNCTFIGNFTF